MPKKSTKRIEALLRERRGLLLELSALPGLIRGSLFERFSTCSRPNCACHKGQRHGPRVYVAVTQQKRQRQYYVPKRQVDAVDDGVRQYHRLLAILDRITAINLELMRMGVLHEHNTG